MRQIGSIAAITLALGCGPGQLSEGGDLNSSGSGSETDSSSSGTESSSSETETETGDGDGDPPMPILPEACALVRVEGDANMPTESTSMSGVRAYTLHAGDARSPARIMTIQHETLGGDEHGEYLARSFVLESPWPEGAVEVESPLPLTHRGHSLSRLAGVADGEPRFAYVWTADPDGVNDYDTFFSLLDAEAWSVSGEVEIESSTNPSFVDLLRTASAERFVATHTSDRYDSTPDGEVSGFSLGILDADGTPLVGATELTARTLAPGSNLRTFWAGDRVAVAIGHNDCDQQDPLCLPHAVTLARPIAPDQHGAAVDGFEVSHTFAGLASTQHVSRPQITVALGYNWLTWYEGDDWIASDEHRTLRGVVLDEHADPLAWPLDSPSAGPIPFMQDTAMAGWPTLLVSEFGITVAYKTADGLFEVRQHDFDFQPLGEPILIELDPSAANYPSMTALAHPRSLVIAWNEQINYQQVFIRMVRLECA